MALRRCATAGCTGTLPAGAGTHCPRCGGSEFIHKGRKGFRVFILCALIAGGLVVGAILINNHGSPPPSPQRQALVESRNVAARMSGMEARDTAYSDILHRALAQHDFEYACVLGGEMIGSAARDQCLAETVDAALKARQPQWADRAAAQIVTTSVRDASLRRILDAKAGKVVSSQ